MMSQDLKSDDEIFQLQSSMFLDFDSFFSAVTIPQEHLKSTKIQDFQPLQFIGVDISENISFKVFKKFGNSWAIKQEIYSNPLGSQTLEIISKKLSKSQEETKLNYKKMSTQLLNHSSSSPPDILVKDIYGPDSSAINLPQNLLASSLGKLQKSMINDFDSNQILRSTIIALAINSAQILALLGRKHKISFVVILKNKLHSKAFNRYFYTIAKYNNPTLSIYEKRDCD